MKDLKELEIMLDSIESTTISHVMNNLPFKIKVFVKDKVSLPNVPENSEQERVKPISVAVAGPSTNYQNVLRFDTMSSDPKKSQSVWVFQDSRSGNSILYTIGSEYVYSDAVPVNGNHGAGLDKEIVFDMTDPRDPKSIVVTMY
ncbi:hypothetical protein [Photorhabdus laumondii]|uniref:hypothetical protein n=1 Tax=Photorhabdus laumondii TaxID=2218628 RepID=UPI003315B7F1